LYRELAKTCRLARKELDDHHPEIAFLQIGVEARMRSRIRR